MVVEHFVWADNPPELTLCRRRPCRVWYSRLGVACWGSVLVTSVSVTTVVRVVCGPRMVSTFVASLSEGQSDDAGLLEEVVMGHLRKAALAAESGAAALVLGDVKFGQQYPALTEYLTRLRHDDGEVREPSSIIVFVREGRWRGCLSDKSAGLSLWAEGTSLTALWASLEGQLTSDSPGWRRASEKGSYSRQKPK